MIRTIMLDDDLNSHKAAKQALGAFSEIDMVGNFTNSKELMDFLEREEADLLFLDIRIGSEFGFSVARTLRMEYPNLMIVFLTGHSSYAIDGYDFQPVNFLTKPINPMKLEQTIEEVKRRMDSVLGQRKAQLMFRTQQGYRILDVREILYIERSNRKNFLVLEGESIQISGYTMKELEQMLSEHGFSLCHQSFLVNLYRITHLRDAGRQLYEGVLKGANHPIPISRNHYDRIKTELESIGRKTL